MSRVVAVSVGVLLGVSALTVVGISTHGILQETKRPDDASAATAPRAVAPTRPPLTGAEEAYIQALWPIHGSVERSAVRMSLGQIFYKTEDIDRPQLKARVEEALTTFRTMLNRLRALEPPASLQNTHDQYTSAVRLFEKSALEAMKMFDDGKDEHLLAAYPFNQEGSNKIREIGIKLWPQEFPAN
jgi:hypothetical protein